MLGRAAWHTPRMLSEVALRFWPASHLPSDARVVDAMVRYAEREVAKGTPLRVITRPMLGLTNGQPGARRWRRMLSDPALLAANDPGLIFAAWRSLHQGGSSSHVDEEENGAALFPAAFDPSAGDALSSLA
jgi:tRNA-dihydrouridine synthase A